MGKPEEKSEKDKPKEKKDKERKDKDKKDAPSKAPAAPPAPPSHSPPKPASPKPPSPTASAESTPKPASPKHQDPSPAAPASAAHSAPKPTSPPSQVTTSAPPTPSADSTPKPASPQSPKPASPTSQVTSSAPPTPSADSAPRPTSPAHRDPTPSPSGTAQPQAAPAMPSPAALSLAANVAAQAAATESSQGLFGYDESISKRLAIFNTPGSGRTLMQVIARSTYASAWFIWIGAIMITTQQPSLREQLVNLYRGMILTSILVLVLRMVCKRLRPPRPDGLRSIEGVAIDIYSFPSSSCALTMIACRFLAVNYQSDGVVVITAAVIVLLIALSSLTLGRIHLFDVLAGWVIALVVFQLSKSMWMPAEVCDRYIRRLLEVLHM